jgi:hypothetical protein
METAVERSLLKDARLTLSHDGLQATRLRLLGHRKCALLCSAHKGSKKAPARPTVQRLAAGSVAKFVAVSLGMELLRADGWRERLARRLRPRHVACAGQAQSACESDANGDNAAVEVDMRTDMCL